MLLAGDEMGRTQGGNNNAYCQDNEISWLDWGLARRRAGPAAVHRDAGRPAPRPPGVPAAPVLPRPAAGPGGEKGDIVWLTPAGEEMTEADWAASYAKSLAVFLNGDAISEPDPRGEKITDARFLLLFNAHSDPITFTLPEASFAAGWEVVIDTAPGLTGTVHTPKSEIEVCDRAVVVLRSTE